MRNSLPQMGFGPWFRGALATAVLFGIADTALAWADSSSVGLGAVITGGALIISLWIVFATLWAVASGAALWAATGTASALPLMGRGQAALASWWHRRHEAGDTRRLANLLALLVGAAAFAGLSIMTTAAIVDGRNNLWVAAATALVAQLGLGLAVLTAALALRRATAALLRKLRATGRANWLNTPNMLAAFVGAGAIAAVVASFIYRAIFFAIEGPALVLGSLALLCHPLGAYLLAKRRYLPPVLRAVLWVVPFLALIGLGLSSQQAEARRLVVRHGEVANFAFHVVHRQVGLDRLFRPSDCPPLGPTGRPTNGQTMAQYLASCLDEAYDLPPADPPSAAAPRPEFSEPPSFIFITWDSVRVDRLGFMGHRRDTTPNLDAFARQGLVFERAFAADSGTGPSFWSLMAGKTPFQVDLVHGHRFPPPIADGEPMLGQLLRDGGYRTQAVMCGSVFDKRDWAIRRGFQTFDNVCGNRTKDLAPQVTDAATTALDRLMAGDKPFFLWVHFYDSHTPYNDHQDIDYGDRPIDHYDEELTYTDRHFGRLIEAIDEYRGDSEKPVYTIMSADHGENFNEHGTDPHARNLYRIVTQVPKIVVGPHIEPRRIDAPVAINDIYPTVLDLAGLSIPDETTMVSQAPLFFGAEGASERLVFQENSYSRPRRHTRAVVYDRYHFILDLTTNTRELYDYVDDPGETTNLAGKGLMEEQLLYQSVLRFLATSNIPEGLED